MTGKEKRLKKLVDDLINYVEDFNLDMSDEEVLIMISMVEYADTLLEDFIIPTKEKLN